jgi:hypothetical protein
VQYDFKASHDAAVTVTAAATAAASAAATVAARTVINVLIAFFHYFNTIFTLFSS